jgi:hypothetical protein
VRSVRLGAVPSGLGFVDMLRENPNTDSMTAFAKSLKQLLGRGFSGALVVVLCVSVVAAPRAAVAQTPPANNGTREFMLSATYGALAGALVGGASLAFSEHPGDNLNKVARGASIGLYAGILLGLYVIYGGSNGRAGDDDEAAQMLNPKLLVAPVVSERGLEGAEARYSLVEF